ncbi:PREDICTED: two-component response regulator-like APRR1 [Fragaria vesca subsp. vesca]|uniref:two-component response regulator-like APRR1 n=1 Tax=Fragaria vesca subsp. vesca TaxID=101020 RepID=UPI0002C33427|nr:PREDICTED: two-component response regulator-like APRR1 [Fragaria vesca subsp. vesca]
MDHHKELNLNKGPEVCGGGGGGEGFIDRSKVRILLCDNDESSSEEVLRLLLKCSYQVTSVKSPRQVIDALNAEGPDIDIILAEVDLPMRKGTRMLKYITRHRELRRIPVIMMSAQDEVSTVVKCLRLGAADYLVKPLRTNELLNLWTHMWRRRHMLGLAEKNVLSYDFDTVVSDPSDPNTNSFSDDTEDKSQKNADPEISAAAVAAATEPPLDDQLEFQSDVPEISDRQTGKFSSGPKKSGLKIGGSSAFFTYVKSSTLENNSQVHTKDNGSERSRVEETHPACKQVVDESPQVDGNGEAWESYSQEDDFPTSNSIPDSLSLERSCTPPGSMELQHQKNNEEDRSSQVPEHPRNEHQHDVSGSPAQASYPYYMSGVVNQAMGSSSTQVYQKNLHDMQNHAAAAIMQHYGHLPHCHPHVNGMTSFPYYPLSICLQPGQMPNNPSWPSFGSSSSNEVKLNKVDRREAALIKFRQKRKERCFDKKIRYVNRKKLAERRPRVRGQFVRKVNGVDVDLNGQPASLDDDEDDEDEKDDEELA